MSLAVVNHTSAFANSAISATTSGLNITAGNLIVLTVNTFSGTNLNVDGVTPVTDSAGNTYTKIDGMPTLQQNRYCELWYAKNCLGGSSVTFTYTLTATDYPQVLVMQISGADPTAPLDQHALSDLNVASPQTTSSITTIAVSEIIVLYSGSAAEGNSTTWTDGGAANSLGTPTTIEDTGAPNIGAAEGGTLAYAIVSGTGTYAGTATISAAQYENVGLASFIAAATTPSSTDSATLTNSASIAAAVADSDTLSQSATLNVSATAADSAGLVKEEAVVTTAGAPSNATKNADANTVVATGWTNPTNAYTQDGVLATAAPAKSTSITTDYGFPAFTTSDIPDGSTINSVQVSVLAEGSTTGSTGAVLGIQTNDNGTLLGAETTTAGTTSLATYSQTVSSGVSLADLRNANFVKARLRGFRSTSNTTITWSADVVQITVNYTPPVTLADKVNVNLTDSVAESESAGVSVTSSPTMPSDSDSATISDSASNIGLSGPADSGTTTESGKIGLGATDSGSTAEAAGLGLGASDTGSAAEGPTGVGLGATESGTTGESSKVGLGATDTATAAEQTAIALAQSDPAAFAEQVAVAAATAGQDSAALAEQLQVALQTSETASLGEAIAIALAHQDAAVLGELVGIAVGTSDTAGLAEQVAIAVSVSDTDAATLGESAQQSSPNRSDTDSAALTEQLQVALGATDGAGLVESLAIALSRNDSATLQELVSVALAIAEVASVAEQQSIAAATAAAELGTLAEQVSIQATPADTDSGTMAEQVAQVLLSTTDGAALIEQYQTAVSQSPVDTGAVEETVQLAVQLFTQESASLGEAAVVVATSTLSFKTFTTTTRVFAFSSVGRVIAFAASARLFTFVAQEP